MLTGGSRERRAALPTLELRYRDPAALSWYRCAHRTADWLICSRCGVLMAVLCEIEGRKRAVVRVQAMPEHSFSQAEQTSNFESETPW